MYFGYRFGLVSVETCPEQVKWLERGSSFFGLIGGSSLIYNVFTIKTTVEIAWKFLATSYVTLFVLLQKQLRI